MYFVQSLCLVSVLNFHCPSMVEQSSSLNPVSESIKTALDINKATYCQKDILFSTVLHIYFWSALLQIIVALFSRKKIDIFLKRFSESIS